MKGFVLQRVDGSFMTSRSNPRSYTKRLAKARIFVSESEAEAEIQRGDDAVVIALDVLINDRNDPVPF